MNVNLENPLSKWEQWKAHFFGAYQPPSACVETERAVLQTVVQKSRSVLKYIALFVFFQNPFLLVMLYGFGYISPTTTMWWSIMIVNALFFFFLSAFYQSIFLKLCNKNFKKYSLKKIIQNKEVDKRRKSALYLKDENTVLELYFCFQCCDDQTIKNVLKWCGTSSERLQYRHLEEMRGHVLEKFSSFSTYTEAFAQWREKSVNETLKAWMSDGTGVFEEKIVKEVYKEMDEIMSVYALRNRLEATANSAKTAPMRHSPRKLRKI